MGSTQSQTCCKSSVSDVPPEVAVVGLPRETPAGPEQKEEGWERQVVKTEPGEETLGAQDIEKLQIEGASCRKAGDCPRTCRGAEDVLSSRIDHKPQRYSLRTTCAQTLGECGYRDSSWWLL